MQDGEGKRLTQQNHFHHEREGGKRERELSLLSLAMIASRGATKLIAQKMNLNY